MERSIYRKRVSRNAIRETLSATGDGRVFYLERAVPVNEYRRYRLNREFDDCARLRGLSRAN